MNTDLETRARCAVGVLVLVALTVAASYAGAPPLAVVALALLQALVAGLVVLGVAFEGRVVRWLMLLTLLFCLGLVALPILGHFDRLLL